MEAYEAGRIGGRFQGTPVPCSREIGAALPGVARSCKCERNRTRRGIPRDRIGYSWRSPAQVLAERRPTAAARALPCEEPAHACHAT